MSMTMLKEKVPGAKKGSSKRKTEDPAKAAEETAETQAQREADAEEERRAEAAQASANYFDANSVEVMTIRTQIVGLQHYRGVVYH